MRLWISGLAALTLNVRAAKPIDEQSFSAALFDHYSSKETLSADDIVTRYLGDQTIFAYLAPPSAGFTLFQPGGILYIPWKNEFSAAFLKNLVSSEESGNYRAFIWVYEDAVSPGRELVIVNDYGVELLRVPREKDYSPDWVVRKICPDLDYYPSAYRDYLYSVFDPARVWMRYTVFYGEADLAAYTDQVALDMRLAALSAPMATAMSQVAVTSLMFTAVGPRTNDTVRLEIGWPDTGLSSNKVEFYTCESLRTGVWSLAALETVNLSTNRHEWIDTDGHTNRISRFYDCWVVHDSDGDGLSDGKEVRIFGTSRTLADTDGEGVDDYTELFDSYYSNTVFHTESRVTDPLAQDSEADGLDDAEERTYGSDPWLADSDGDGIDDLTEVTNGWDPVDPLDPPSNRDIDTDGDGMFDGWESLHGFNRYDPSDAARDADGDGLANLNECLLGSDPRSDAFDPPGSTSASGPRFGPGSAGLLLLTPAASSD